MLKISFNYDEDLKTISDLQVIQETPVEDDSLPVIKLTNNKLVFSEKALRLLKAAAGDRIAVNYIQTSNTETYPVIGKSSMFTDPEAGNKLTKSNTVSFKGMQHELLSKYGKVFQLEFIKNGIYKLIKIDA